jgi:hypothetical protein
MRRIILIDGEKNGEKNRGLKKKRINFKKEKQKS